MAILIGDPAGGSAALRNSLLCEPSKLVNIEIRSQSYKPTSLDYHVF